MGASVLELGHWSHASPVQHAIHAEILRDNIADAQEQPSYGKWAGGIVRRYS